MQVVYVIQHTKTKQIYIGCTNNMQRRLQEHNANQTTATRRTSGQWTLIYCEVYRNTQDAQQREMRLKDHGRAKQELLKRIEHCLLED